MVTKISIVDVKEYSNIPEAVISAIKLIEDDLGFDITHAEKILLKPNLLTSKKDACTQPAFVEGVISYLKEIGVSMSNIYLGDSPGQSEKFGSDVAKEIGIYEICEAYDINFVDFESGNPINEDIEGALKLKKIHVAKIVKDCDILINLPRLKSHLEATMTGAIKNYWGIIPGGLKAQYHLYGKNTEQFGEVLADNFSWIVKNKPNRLVVYDLQEIMEGRFGPGGGSMKKWDLILVGTDELALDVVALEIGKVKIKNVPHVKNAIIRNLGVGNLENIEIVGMSLEEAKKQTPKFNVPGNRFTNFIAYMSGRIGYKIIKKIPKLLKDMCIKCGECAQNCPAKAIEFQENSFPIFLREKCISCFCCAELCSEVAIDVKNRGLSGLFHKY
ncbi:MAG: DUF362 domain-containing protein [Promethearchaeota archaeon]|jgi:uncharacterized protein (DUF362 family)/Pyruvate/2-oxoacid:ferredoxin oxidoreductase delta subunit